MRRHDDKTIISMRACRKQTGLSYEELSRKFGIPGSTIRNWCYELRISRTDSLSRKNESLRLSYKNSELGSIPNFSKLSQSQAKFLCALLYGCEGSKYPASSGISFCNSDPYLIRTFYKMLTKSFAIDKDRMYFHLQIHNNQNYEELLTFWRKLLDLPNARFIEPTVTAPKGGKHRETYYGTCRLRYGDYRLQLKLQGIYERFIAST